MKNYVKLDELFSLPIGLEVGIVIGGEKFYTSDKLKQSFILAFKKSSRGKPIVGPIEKLIEKEYIIPAYKRKGLLKFFKAKMFASPEDKYALAMYYINEKKIIILIDIVQVFLGQHQTIRLFQQPCMSVCIYYLEKR